MNILRKILNSSKSFGPTTNSIMCSRHCVKVVESSNNVEKTFTPPPFLKLPSRTSERKKQNYNYFLVLDFEATCDSPVTVIPQEVIEFPVLKVSAETFEVESVFHSFVRPIVHPQLTKFCTQLTGITQEQIDGQSTFEDVFEKFHRWLEAENLLNNDVKFACAMCGDWDLKYMLPMQCKFFKIPIPPYLKRWINVKVSFTDMAQLYPRNLVTMMKYCQLKHEGKLHSGIDDCKNIAKVLKDLADRGMVYECNGQTL